MNRSQIVFKCEASLWDMLAEEGVTGIPAKPFDMRRYDTSDDRIYRLTEGSLVSFRLQRTPQPLADETVWKPDVDAISFLNKATDEVLTRRYLGMEFVAWAPGWCFLLLGARLDAGGARVLVVDVD